MDPVAVISAIAGAAVLVIGAVAVAAEKIITALGDTQKSLREIHVLVNSRYSAVLNDLALALTEAASKSGLEVDAIAAEVAQQAADRQAERVVESEKKDQP